MTNLPTPYAPSASACPSCLAPPGLPCRSLAGTVVSEHRNRDPKRCPMIESIGVVASRADSAAIALAALDTALGLAEQAGADSGQVRRLREVHRRLSSRVRP